MATAEHHGTTPEVFKITGARKSQQQDMHERMVKYAISMGVRTACFVLAVIFSVVLHAVVLTWIFVVGAFALPYVAVLIANAGREKLLTPMTLIGRGPRQASTLPALTGTIHVAQPSSGAHEQTGEATPRSS